MAINSCLLALGALGFIICSVAGVLSCLLVGCFAERRVKFKFYFIKKKKNKLTKLISKKGYGGQFVENFYKSIPANTPVRSNQAPMREMGLLKF